MVKTTDIHIKSAYIASPTTKTAITLIILIFLPAYILSASHPFWGLIVTFVSLDYLVVKLIVISDPSLQYLQLLLYAELPVNQISILYSIIQIFNEDNNAQQMINP